MGDNMNLQEQILNKINNLNIGVFTISDIIELGSYDNLRKSLERMAKNNSIKRVIRGVYEIPKYNAKLNFFVSPSINEIAKALARNHKWDISPSGNFALNILGVSSQVPSKYLYLSSGPSRKYQYEGVEIEFKHVALKEIISYSYNTNLVIMALKELGRENITIKDLEIISSNFNQEELQTICDEAKSTTIWIYETIVKMKGMIK